MDFIKRIYTASIVLSLAFFAACGDSDSSDITTPNNSSETDITDTASQDTATTVKDSSATSDSTTTRDSSAVKSSSSVEMPSSANNTTSSSTGNSSSSSGNNTSSSSITASTSSSSIIDNNTGSCNVKLDTLYGYLVTCDGIALGHLINELGKDYIAFENEGKNCSLNDHMDGIVDVSCGQETHTLYKKLCKSTPYDPMMYYCNGTSLIDLKTYSGPAIVECKESDLWCHNPNTDGTNVHNDKITYKEDNNAGFYFNNTGTQDLTDWGGICITYTSDTSAHIFLDLGEEKNLALGNNLPQQVIAQSPVLPTERCISWSDFKQRRWGSPTILGKDAAKSIASFKIEFQGKPQSKFNLIRVRTYSEGFRKDNVRPLCGNMWCGSDCETQVTTFTSSADGYDTGDWQGTTDKADGGTSTVTWPYRIGNDFNPNALDDIIYMYESVAGTYTLGSGIASPYVKIGFEIDNMDTRDYDISKWKGICLSYKADFDFTMELTSSDNNATNPKVSIPKSYNATTIDLPWTELNPPDASKVSFINFVFSGAAGTTGYFAFYSVGKLGTCTRQN